MNRGLLLALSAAALLAGCEREMRSFETPVSQTTPTRSAARQSSNQPAAPLGGGVKQPTGEGNPYEENAYAVNQGKQLYRWYNCNGCHAGGGGSIGPALMDAEWRYGSEPAQIFQTITQGRPNGMPSFGGHIPEDQEWQLVAYIRSMSGQLPKDVAPSRADALAVGLPENARPRETLRAETPQPNEPSGGPQR